MKQNPKMVGSNLIDCVPQHGPCPNNCDQCFYQKWFYAGHEPVIPTQEEAKGKIVRVNSGNDSNYQKELVMDVTENYRNKFYNTSIPDLEFNDNPVVLTINPRQDKCWTAMKHGVADNLMFVRYRANTWNWNMAQDALEYYTQLGVPFVVTFMRYYDDVVRHPARYEFKKHVLHDYWDITEDGWHSFMEKLRPNDLLFTCGTPESHYCRDCGVCETLYWRYMFRMGGVAKRLEDIANGT